MIKEIPGNDKHIKRFEVIEDFETIKTNYGHELTVNGLIELLKEISDAGYGDYEVGVTYDTEYGVTGIFQEFKVNDIHKWCYIIGD